MANNRSPIEKLHNKSDDPVLEARLEEILQLLYSFYAQEIDMSLERVGRFLHQLGDPQLKLPPVIHVAGTNGKGSTVATLRSLLEADGKRVHVMTSPHLVHPTERIRLAGELISTRALVDVLEECLAVNRSEPITFFEMLTAATYLAMSRVPADYAILETGMGGRLDATNVVPDPLCTIITTISKDHEKFLGDTLDRIAFEKAGIMKAGVPCIIGYQTDDAIDAGVINVFHEVSKSLSPEAKLFRYGENWVSRTQGDLMQFRWQEESVVTSHPNLVGPHQIYNAGAALAAFRVIKNRPIDAEFLSPQNPKNPLLTIHWPGRLQRLNHEPICDLLDADQELWIDGAHNDSAGYFLAQQMKQWRSKDDRPLHLIVAMVNRKNPKDFLQPLVPYVKTLQVTQIENEASSYTADELFDRIKSLGFQNLSTAENAEMAIRNIQDKNARILITGSLYFLGTILS
ncbi:MAG TPA: folylpolyglutamate synthase/dihydrofolate synthase family protein [Alphaproteobacteria bacterium]|nr:folylpolyglutamate synthase/dihydrofolate synthase family protein [Alphaproteobacteria bacterium]